MTDTLSGIDIAVRLLQPANADSPIFVTPSGICIPVILSQQRNANSPIPSESSQMSDGSMQSENKPSPVLGASSAIEISARLKQH